MRCEDARAALDALRYADEGDTAAEQAAQVAHLQGCPDCQAYAERGRALDRMLALDQPIEPGPGFDTRFFARLADARRARRRRSLWRWSWALLPVGVGAALALLRIPAPAPPEGGDADTPPPLERTGQDADDLSTDDLAVIEHLELLENLPVLQRLEEVEAFEALDGVDDAELDAMLAEVQ